MYFFVVLTHAYHENVITLYLLKDKSDLNPMASKNQLVFSIIQALYSSHSDTGSEN